MHKRFLRYPITSICPISADGEHGKEANVYLSTDISAAPVTVMERPLRAVLRNCPFIPSQCLIRTGPAQKCGGCDERVPFGQDYTLALRLATVGPFLSVDCSLAYIPHGRAGQAQRRQAPRVARFDGRTCAFHRGPPCTAWRLKQYACQRAAGRARRFAARYRKESKRRATGLYLRSHVPILSGHVKFIETCANIIIADADARPVRLNSK